MSIMLQNKCSLRSLTHVPTCPPPCPVALVTPSATPTTEPMSSKNQLVIEPRLVMTTPDLVTPFPNVGPSSPDDPRLQSTWSHRAWVASGCITLLISLAKAVMGAADLHMWFEPMLAGFVGYIFADLLSGFYHWGIDNYGDASTPILGSQIERFQGHHKCPWGITMNHFANNLHLAARSITVTVLPINILCNEPVIQGFVSVCAGCVMFSQQIHAWSHGNRSKLPRLVVVLQDAGLILSRSRHSPHHRPPYDNNYCIISGICNAFLDKIKVFDTLERVIFFMLGVRPRSWSEPGAEWVEETDETRPEVH